MNQTLLDMLQVKPKSSKLSESVLLIVDAQREYQDGKIPLSNIEDSLKEIAQVLKRARLAQSPIVFVRHSMGKGAPIFNPDSEYFQIIESVKPESGEIVIDKNYPNSFAETNLQSHMEKLGLKNLIITGFMTHACISTTARSAAERGFNATVVADACATRDLPSIDGNLVSANEVHYSTLAALQDVFAKIVKSSAEIES